MATAVSAKYDLVCTSTVTVDHGDQNVTNTPLIVHSLGTMGGTLNANSTPPVSQDYSAEITLSAGAATLDFTAMDQGDLPDQDMTGLKPQLCFFKADSTNTAGIVVTDGATNGHNIWGDANGSVTFLPGAKLGVEWNDQLDDVAAGDATIDLSSSDLDAKIKIQIVFG